VKTRRAKETLFSVFSESLLKKGPRSRLGGANAEKERKTEKSRESKSREKASKPGLNQQELTLPKPGLTLNRSEPGPSLTWSELGVPLPVPLHVHPSMAEHVHVPHRYMVYHRST